MPPPLPAILLAAGRGERLRPLTDDRPKAMIEVGDEPLVTRALRYLRAAGLGRIVAVSGWRSECLRDLDCEVRHNERWEENNVVSLWAVGDLVEGGCFVVNSDVLFQPQVAERLAGLAETTLLVDGSHDLDAEAMKAELDGERLVRLSKRADPDRSAGEYIGLLRIDPAEGPRLAQILDEFVASGRTEVYYEDAVEELAKERPVGVERIDGLGWVEIDDHDDLDRAREIAGRLE